MGAYAAWTIDPGPFGWTISLLALIDLACSFPRPDSLGRDPDVWEYTSCRLESSQRDGRGSWILDASVAWSFGLEEKEGLWLKKPECQKARTCHSLVLDLALKVTKVSGGTRFFEQQTTSLAGQFTRAAKCFTCELQVRFACATLQMGRSFDARRGRPRGEKEGGAPTREHHLEDVQVLNHHLRSQGWRAERPLKRSGL